MGQYAIYYYYIGGNFDEPLKYNSAHDRHWIYLLILLHISGKKSRGNCGIFTLSRYERTELDIKRTEYNKIQRYFN